MDRIEAIKYLTEGAIYQNAGPEEQEMFNEAIDIAVEALELQIPPYPLKIRGKNISLGGGIFDQKASLFGIDYGTYAARDKEWLKHEIWSRCIEATSYESILIDSVLLFELIDRMDDYSRGRNDGLRDALNDLREGGLNEDTSSL